MIRYSLLLILIFIISNLTFAQQKRNTPEEYIEQFKDIAISEMIRSGIPASIKLAQGILESGSGNSQLSRQGNNHFGIKCRNDWQGRRMFYDDDEANECFRVYRNAKDSYRDHTEFLVNGYRYRLLFDLDPDDYKGWARGLRQAGYATNPRYAELLINIIERYELYQYDYIALAEIKSGKNTRRESIRNYENNKDQYAILPDDKVFEFNGIPAIAVQSGDTYQILTKRYNLLPGQLARFNDIERKAYLEAGTILYIKPKRGRPAEFYHSVAVGDDMHSISQQYGIRLNRLYRINRMELGEEPAAGERIHLRRRRSEPPLLRQFDIKENLTQKKLHYTSLSDNKQGNEVIVEDVNIKDAENISMQQNFNGKSKNIHVVQTGETLFSIARQYNLSIENIMKLNNLENTDIQIGQLLIVNNFQNLEAIITEMPEYHIVEPGETLYSISRQYGLSIEDLKVINQLESLDVKIGMKLILPR